MQQKHVGFGELRERAVVKVRCSVCASSYPKEIYSDWRVWPFILLHRGQWRWDGEGYSRLPYFVVRVERISIAPAKQRGAIADLRRKLVDRERCGGVSQSGKPGAERCTVCSGMKT
jgi:hypothetical protein